MEYRPLGRTGLKVSLICLGTMTFGEQNSEADAHEQLDYALTQGVNFIDTAEMYPVPPRAETQGLTETYVGTWLKQRKDRDKIILATKVTGRSSGFNYLQRGETRLNGQHINEAVNNSLKRLQTDYIDLYQLHWPDRSVNIFGQLGYTHNAGEESVPLLETLEALNACVKAGKIRHVGLSNETPWGTLGYLHLAEKHGLPRMASVQNPYSLLNRSYEVAMAEISIREECGLLAYSPLAMGVLSGKYLNGARPPKGRITLFSRFQRYNTPSQEKATARYVQIAKDASLDPSQMALAFINQQPFVTSNIIGATTIDQLKINIGSTNVKLAAETVQAINAVHREISNPCP